MNQPIHNPRCRADHFGAIYAVRPMWLSDFVGKVNRGLLPRVGVERPEPKAAAPAEPSQQAGDLAIVSITGPMFKGFSKFAETDTLEVRRAIRAARRSSDVRGILLHIDSPGGSVAGVQELADEVAAAAREKPVHAHIDDLGASAGYYVASQALKITANKSAIVGSIGVFEVLEDTSKMNEDLGVKVHLIATGPLKGGGVDGVPISDATLEDERRIIKGLGALFFEAVSKGRGLKGEKLDAVTTGGIWLATEAVDVGLVDEIDSSDGALAGLQRAVKALGTPRRDRAERTARIERLR